MSSFKRLIAESREFLPFANAVFILVHAVVLGRRLNGRSARASPSPSLSAS